jgi:hypothetical protein
LKVGSIVIDYEKFDAMFAFWQETLHYRPREPAEGGWVVLADGGEGPNISLNRVQRRSAGRNRFHIDLYTEDREGEV